MPYKIKGKGHITSEVAFGLSHISCKKIGVTGSDGKTTVSTLISKMLCAEGKNAFLCGNNGNPVISYMGKARKSDYLVCELSSFQLTDLAPALDCGVVTNLTPNHLDIHSSYEEYVYAKSNILKNACRGVINFDCSESRRLGTYLKSGSEMTFASLSYENVRGINSAHLVYVMDGYIFRNGKRIIPLSDIRLKGEFNLINVCLAIGAV
jgi:UDP-N-acetylmuramoylalanine--D-glutamate ligase